MLLPVFAALALGAAPQVKLAAPGLSHVGVDDPVAAMFSQHIAQQLALNGIQVTTQQEISALIGLDRQKQLLGCGDNSSQCLTELAGALGVDGVITGTVAKLDNGYLLDLKIVSARDGSALAVVSHRGTSDGELVDWLTQIAPEIAEQLKAIKSGLPVAVRASGGLRSKSWIPLVAGGAFLIAGAALLVDAYTIDHQLRTGDPKFTVDPSQTAARLNAAVNEGNLSQSLGWTAVGLAAACGATALGFYLFGGDGPQVSALLTRDAAFAAVRVRWP